jgi:hypothetical protein
MVMRDPSRKSCFGAAMQMLTGARPAFEYGGNPQGLDQRDVERMTHRTYTDSRR